MMVSLNLWKTLIDLLMRFLRKFFDRENNKYTIFNTCIFIIILIKKTYKKTKKDCCERSEQQKSREFIM